MKQYWSENSLYHNQQISSIMSRNRFIYILNNLHLVDNDDANTEDILWKIRPMMDMLNSSFRKYWKPSDRVAVDEAMIPFRGRISFKQYMKDKPTKWGFKMWKLCDSL